MNIEGKVVIERYSDGKLLERRETENVLRSTGAEFVANIMWIGSEVRYERWTMTTLIIANYDKTTIKWLRPQSIERINDTAGMKWVTTLQWTDVSTDTYTIYYLGLMYDGFTPSVGANNITGSPPSCYAARIDPPVIKESTDILTILWRISIPYGEVT